MLVVAYDGTDYCGWQLQPNGMTIEEMLNNALSDLLGEEIKVSGASRTDSGVHAYCNLAIFDTNARMPGEKMSYALNQRLPENIRVRKSMEVAADFHPRFEKTVKTYEYRIWNDEFPLPSRRLYTHFCYYRLDIDKMQQAGSYLVGEHDFKSFCSVSAQVESTVRCIRSLDVYRDENSPGKHEVVIRVSGEGFLYNMVRIIAGTLIEVGRGEISPETVREMLEGCDRQLSGPTAPARGLTLVQYEFQENGMIF